jgi:probable HAF family extracellular repeat protein
MVVQTQRFTGDFQRFGAQTRALLPAILKPVILRHTGRLVLVALSAATLAICGPVYQIVDLGALGGGTSGGAGINQNGVVAGWSLTSSGSYQGFFNSGGAIQGLGSLSGGIGNAASAINGAGQIAGTTYTADGGSVATVWNSGTPTSLGTLGGYISYATGINASGAVTGLATDSAGNAQAFLYRNGAMTTLTAGTWASGYGVNATGSVVGTVESTPGHFQAFIWTPGSGLTTLGSGVSHGMGINNAGRVVGSAVGASGYTRAFYSDGTGLNQIGTLGGGNSYAYGVNGFGDIVGYSDTATGGTAGFLWSNGVLYDLNALVGLNRGWMITEAYGINDKGQITGTGIHDGASRAFRLDPIQSVALHIPAVIPAGNVPEPSTFWMLATACGLASLASLRRPR